MKLTVIAFLLGIASVSGSVVIVETGGAFAPEDITGSTGQSIVSSGFAAIGTWDGTALVPGVATSDDLAAAFSIGDYKFADGSDNAGVPIEAYAFMGNSAEGFLINNITKASIETAGDVGKNIAVAIWRGPDADDLATAIEATVFQLDQRYERSPGPLAINYLESPGMLVFGNSMTQLGILVPEPSSSLLLCLGALGFLVRRKR